MLHIRSYNDQDKEMQKQLWKELTYQQEDIIASFPLCHEAHMKTVQKWTVRVLVHRNRSSDLGQFSDSSPVTMLSFEHL